jgi:hypothetical protein
MLWTAEGLLYAPLLTTVQWQGSSQFDPKLTLMVGCESLGYSQDRRDGNGQALVEPLALSSRRHQSLSDLDL